MIGNGLKLFSKRTQKGGKFQLNYNIKLYSDFAFMVPGENNEDGYLEKRKLTTAFNSSAAVASIKPATYRQSMLHCLMKHNN